MIMRYKLTVSYDGSDFYGFQRQRGLISVQECLEEALSTKLNEPVTIACAGRTDAGVHALGQVVHFDYDGELPADFGFRLNPLLPESIAVLSCEPAAAGVVPCGSMARAAARRLCILWAQAKYVPCAGMRRIQISHLREITAAQ